jgi:hypothetical protein
MKIVNRQNLDRGLGEKSLSDEIFGQQTIQHSFKRVHWFGLGNGNKIRGQSRSTAFKKNAPRIDKLSETHVQGGDLQ